MSAFVTTTRRQWQAWVARQRAFPNEVSEYLARALYLDLRAIERNPSVFLRRAMAEHADQFEAAMRRGHDQ